MEHQEQVEPEMTALPTESKLEESTTRTHNVDLQEKSVEELAAKLRENGCFDFKSTRDYNVEVIANAVSMNWEQWDEITRKTISSWFVNAYKYKNDIKGMDIPTLRVLIASNILEVDPINALRILASVIIHGHKPLKPFELLPKLCKAIQFHFLQGDIPRYQKLFSKSYAEETRVVLQHVVAVISGPYCDMKDTALASKQLQLVTCLLDQEVFNLLDPQSIDSIVFSAKSWPMSMLSDLSNIIERYYDQFPNTINPFELISSQFIKLRSDQQPQLSPPEPAQINSHEPRDVISIVSECFNKLEGDIVHKQQEIEGLQHSLIQAAADNHRIDESRERKQKAIESLQEENRKLREEIDTLKLNISTKNSLIATLQDEKNVLGREVKLYEEKITALGQKHEQSVEYLSNSIENVSEHKINELKRSIEIDLKNEFDELSHLPTDESCIFHMDVLKTIFRKLRQRGIDIGGRQ